MKIILAILITIPVFTFGQIHDDLDNRVNGLTTIVESRLGKNVSQGSGFFYYEFYKDTSKADTTQNKGKFIKGFFLITNRHVVFQKDTNGKEHMPDNLTFYLRSFTDSIFWSPITISKTVLAAITIVNRDPKVDIVAIYINQFMPKNLNIDSNQIKNFNGVFEDLLPNNKSPWPQVTDDVVVIGYPKGFYDHKNLYPIVKTGIISSKWGAKFNGHSYFLIDSKLFPGSSGSLVLSKPTDFVVIDGNPAMSAKKQFLFLGIYSGEPYSTESGDKYDVGIVWYGSLIKGMIETGMLWR